MADIPPIVPVGTPTGFTLRSSGLLVPLRKSYADALNNITGVPPFTGFSDVLQGVVIVDNVSGASVAGPSSSASGTGTVSAGPTTSTPANPTPTITPSIGQRVASGVWTPAGAGLATASLTTTTSYYLKYPPPGWAWEIVAILTLRQTGASVAYDAAGTTPENWWFSPNAIDAMQAEANGFDGSGNLPQWSVFTNGMAIGPKKNPAGTGLATGTNYMSQLQGYGFSSFDANIFGNTAEAFPEAMVNGGTWGNWIRVNGGLPIIGKNGGFGVTYRAGAAGQAVTILAVTVIFNWIWTGI